MSCSATGYPLPTVVWRSPGGKRLDRSFLDKAQDIYGEIYSIHENIIERSTRKYAFERNQGYSFCQAYSCTILIDSIQRSNILLKVHTTISFQKVVLMSKAWINAAPVYMSVTFLTASLRMRRSFSSRDHIKLNSPIRPIQPQISLSSSWSDHHFASLLLLIW